jgi:hypothetical protein
VTRHRFAGAIAGVGSTSGVRVVVGRWRESPFGPFADAMVETAAGHRVLIAPTREVADFVAETYTFDEVRVEDIAVTGPDVVWQVTSRSLSLTIGVGERTLVGRLLSLIPAPVATHPAWASAADPFSRVVLRGVRTRGAAGTGRREWYGATDVRVVVRMHGRFDLTDLGALAPVDPPCRFGFSSTPRRPSVTSVVTTVDVD